MQLSFAEEQVRNRSHLPVRAWVAAFCALAPQLAAAQSSAGAASYPNRAVRFVIGYAPGGGNDTMARLIAPKLSAVFGQQVVVDNRPGAGGTIAAAIVAKAEPDGYTMLMSALSTHGVGPSLYRNLGYDPIKDFEPISLLGITPMVLGINPKTLPEVNSVQDLIKAAKAKPGQIKYASSGVASPPHTAAAIFESVTGVKMTHIPYKGGGPAMVELMAGETNLMFGPAATMLIHAKMGRVKALAISRPKRLAEFPGLPTFAEAGLPGYEANAWWGVHAPAKTPKPIVVKWHSALVKIINSPDFDESLKAVGIEGASSTPEEFDRFVRKEVAKYAKVIKDTGMEGK